MVRQTDYNPCPKCKKNTATSGTSPDGSSRFYCTQTHCSFEVATQKQDMRKACDQLRHIKEALFKP